MIAQIAKSQRTRVRGPLIFERRASGQLLVARGFFFAGQLIVPSVVTQPQLAWKWLGFANADLAALIQKLLNKRLICCFLGHMFHRASLTALSQIRHP